MAEKGTLVADAATGESIATRDAVWTDNDANPRVIQIVDRASRPGGFNLSVPIRTNTTGFDTFDFSSGLPAGISNNLITIGDATSINVCVIHNFTAGKIILTPIIVEASAVGNDPIGLLEPKLFGAVSEDPLDDYAGRFDIGALAGLTAYSFLTIMQTWEVKGAARIGLHIGGTTNWGASSEVQVFAAVGSDNETGHSAIDSSDYGFLG